VFPSESPTVPAEPEIPSSERAEPVQEEIPVQAEPVEEETFESDEPLPAQEKGLTQDILDLLNDHPEGLKMVDIAHKLSVTNWRSLIPVMRELIDEEEVRKEDTLYFVI
jgi:hypothetical protein